VVVMLSRGSPARQCEPRGSLVFAGLRRSYPSSVRVIPLTPLISANAEALLSVGPVLTSRSPSFFLSLASPVGQAGSVKVPVGVVLGKVATLAPVGQPMPLSHCACTRKVFAGSNSPGLAWNFVSAKATPVLIVMIAKDARSVRAFMCPPWDAGEPVSPPGSTHRLIRQHLTAGCPQR